MQLTVFTAGIAMASANSNMPESSAHVAHRQNHQLQHSASTHQMYHGPPSQPQGKSPQVEEHPKLHELWYMMHNATTSLDPHTIHTMERHIGPAMNFLHQGCNQDWINFCLEEIQTDARRVHALKLSFPHTHVDMARVVCLAKKFDQFSSHCKTNIALLDLTKTNHHGHIEHSNAHHHTSDHHHAVHTYAHHAGRIHDGVGKRPVIRHADIVSHTMLASDLSFSVDFETPGAYSAILLGFLFLWSCCRIARYCCEKRKQTQHPGFGDYAPVENYCPPALTKYQPCLV